MTRRNVIIALILFWAVVIILIVKGCRTENSCETINHVKNLQWGNDTISNLYLYWYDSCGVISDGRILDIDDPNDKMLLDLILVTTKVKISLDNFSPYRDSKFDTVKTCSILFGRPKVRVFEKTDTAKGEVTIGSCLAKGTKYYGSDSMTYDWDSLNPYRHDAGGYYYMRGNKKVYIRDKK